MNNTSKIIYSYFITVLFLSLILWILGYIFRSMLLPGLPVSSFMAIIPVIAAIIIGTRYNSTSYIPTIIWQIKDLARIENKFWILAAGLVNPLIFLGTYFILLLKGNDISGITPVNWEMLVTFGVFVIAAYTEELGWTGFLLPILQKQKSWISAGIFIGLFHSFWHYIPFLQAGRSIAWILWQTLYLTAIRIILIWLFRRSGGIIFIAVLFHATINISWQLFPVNGSYYEPAITGTISMLIAIILIIYNQYSKSRDEKMVVCTHLSE